MLAPLDVASVARGVTELSRRTFDRRIAVRADGSTRLLMYSDVGHLPAQKQTWTGQGAGWANAPAH